MKKVLLCTGICLLVGCGLQPRMTPKDVAPLQLALESPVTAKIGVISDTQIHESRGTASRYFSKAGDEIVEVTIRTGQQVIGSTDILYEAIKGLSGVPLVLHIGDALDVSCRTEWDAFKRTMAVSPAGPPWVLVGGNHDGFYVGNASPSRGTNYEQAYWQRVCNPGRSEEPAHVFEQRHFNKHSMISENLVHISDVTGKPLVGDVAKKGECKLHAGLVSCVAWDLEEERPWASWLVQVVRLPAAQADSRPVYAIALDSSTYAAQPIVALRTPVLAGVEAGFGVQQLEAVQKIVGQLPRNARFFLVAHHNLRQWNVGKLLGAQRALLGQVIGDERFLNFVLTAHTHEGGWYDHALLGKAVVELNTGSLADPPMYYRDLQFFVTEGGQWRVRSNRIDMELASFTACAAYQAPEDGSRYSVNDQRSENDRLHEAPGFIRQVRRVWSAVRRFFAFWEAKHEELTPQLLTWRDVVNASLPADHGFTYSTAHTHRLVVLEKRLDLEKHLEHFAKCYDGEECSVSQKGMLLKKLEEDFAAGSTAYPPEVIERAHNARLCAALSATEKSGREDGAVKGVLEWSKPTAVELPGGT